MNKLAHFIEHYRALGAQDALNAGHTKTARFMPSSRLGKAALGALGIGGGIAAAKAMSQPEPGMLENMYEGGKDMLSNLSQDDIMGYANMLQQLNDSGGGYSMGYDAGSLSPVDYGMQDIGYADYDPSSQMGYEAQMSPEEMQQYMAYYS